jgi:hypothetical protein
VSHEDHRGEAAITILALRSCLSQRIGRSCAFDRQIYPE